MLLWGFNARPSLLLSISNCSVLLVLESKICDVFKVSHRKNFHSTNFRILEFCARYAKFCTIRKFPAIRYVVYSELPCVFTNDNKDQSEWRI